MSSAALLACVTIGKALGLGVRIVSGAEVGMNNRSIVFHLAFIPIVLSIGFYQFITSFSEAHATPLHTSQHASSSEPASIVLVVDMSASLFGGKDDERQALSNSLAQLVQTNNPQCEYSIVSVSTEPSLLVDRATDTKAVLDRLNRLFSRRKGGATALYDACDLALKKISQAKYSRRLILIISDGVDTSSYKTIDGLHKAMVGSKTPIYTINIGSSATDIHTFNQGKRFLEDIAGASGGKSFIPKNTEEIKFAIESIQEELRR